MEKNDMESRRGPITEADLHAYADGQLGEGRRLEIEAYLAAKPEEQARVLTWVRDNEALRELLGRVLAEPIPARIPSSPPKRNAPWRTIAAAASIAALGIALGWFGRGFLTESSAFLSSAHVAFDSAPAFARRAAIAHVVYSPEVRRPVEVGAEQEDQLVAWLSRRLEAPLKPPKLGALGYQLIGGRLLPGERGPVAQFMYHDELGQRLTLYVAREAAPAGERAFRFAKEGPVSVFYWVDGGFGYALSAGIERAALYRVADEVYRQLSGT